MKKGFTLIELLIVISIIGILAVALLPNILSAPATARDAGRKTALNTVVAALEQIKAATGQYPTGKDGAGTAISLSDITNIEKHFKGGHVPEGAPVVGDDDVETVLGLEQIVDSKNVVYCPLNTNVGGYSYAVAIRMEQPQGGDNGLNISKTCNSSDGEDLGGGSSNWYFLVQ